MQDPSLPFDSPVQPAPLAAGRRRSGLAGGGLVAALWVVAAYLVIHYGVVLAFGAERLHGMLGERLYNALIPAGGLTGILFLLMLAAAWALPFLLAAVLTAFALHWLFPRRDWRERRRIALLLALALTVALPFVLLDGWPAPLWALPFGDDTTFAPGYSAWDFWWLREGTTEEQARAALGEPLRRHVVPGLTGSSGATKEWWHWSVAENGHSYRKRSALFVEGVLVEKHAEFYVD